MERRATSPARPRRVVPWLPGSSKGKEERISPNPVEYSLERSRERKIQAAKDGEIH